MAECLGRFQVEECQRIRGACRLLKELVNLTSLVAPRGWSHFSYAMDALGRDTDEGGGPCIVGWESLDEGFASMGPQCPDSTLDQGKALMHITLPGCRNQAESVLRSLGPLISGLPVCRGALEDEDWRGGRVVIRAVGDGYRVQIQRHLKHK
jgi:hypothetical protein